MARVSNIDIPDNKRVVISLTYIFGIGKSTSIKILKSANVDEDKRVKDLSEEELTQIRKYVSDYLVEGDLRREEAFNKKRLMEIACYRGIRHRRGLPVRGQVTQKNARTLKGPRKTVANKKKATK